MKFRSVIQLNKINPYVLVTAGRARRLKPGWRKPMPVLVQVNGEPNPPWRVNMMPVGGGGFYLYLNGVVRKASGTGVGDRVEVTVTFDEGYRGGPMHEAPPNSPTVCAPIPGRKRHGTSFRPAGEKKCFATSRL